jgi:hypothetical protein
VSGRYLALILVAAGLAVGVLDIPSSGAGGTGTFSAMAASSALRVSLTAPGYAAVEELIDFGSPVAQAAIDSLGESNGFAAYPYPGTTFLAGPGTLAGLLGQGLPSFFTYPLITSSSYPRQPKGELTQPGYHLMSASDASSSEALAESGASTLDSAFGYAAASAGAVRDAVADVVTVQGTNRVKGFALAGVLTVGHTTSAAKVTRTGAGALTRNSSFAVDGISVGGRTVGLSPDGFVTPATRVPPPDAAALTAILARAGVTMRYLRGIDLPDGVVSPGLAIAWTEQVPNGPQLVLTVTLGQVIARASAEAGSPVVAELPEPLPEPRAGPAPATGASPSPSRERTTSVPNAPSVAPDQVANGSMAANDAEVTGSGDLLSARPAAPPPAPPAALAPAARTRVFRVDPTLNSFYSVLLFAALAGAVGTVALRRAGK